MKNEEVLQIAKEESSILQTVNRRKADWIGSIMGRNRLLTEAQIG
jgi:hypothetical protein